MDNNQGVGVPDLDQLINQITQNGDFKKMMDNITENVNVNGNTNVERQTDLKEVETSSSEPNKEESLYDTCCTFLTDNEGNSLAEILSSINGNLQKIAESLEKTDGLVLTNKE